MSMGSAGGVAPRLAEGVQFLGEYQDSGHAQPPMLVRRGDGQVVQLSPLLYALARLLDGETAADALAERVSANASRKLTNDGVAFLLEQKLRPLGLLAGENGPQEPPRARPLLALRAQQRFIPEPTVNRLTAVLAQLFRAPAVATVLIAVALVDYAVLVRDGVGDSLLALARTPAFLLAVLALVLASIVFHELGHAAGCRYGGGRPGAIGVGIFLVWPAFYTNVNDAYRLSRTGRLRTDLGGGYFSLISVVALGLAYAASDWPPFAIAIIAIQFQLVQQLLPIVRLDGYYILSDLVGVPDLFSRVGPILRNLFRRQPRDPRVRDLRPRIRIVVTAWVLTVVPLLATSLGLLLLHLPTYLRRSWTTLQAQLDFTGQAISNADAIGVALGVVQVTTVVIPAAGITLLITRLGRIVANAARRAARRQHARPRHDLPRTGAAIGMDQQNNGGALHDSGRGREERAAQRQRSLLRLNEGAPPIRRDEVYPRRVVDGRELGDSPLNRLRDAAGELLRSAGERDELALDGEITGLPGVSRSNTVAVISPKGGVGKTTSTFLIGDALSDYLKLRVVAVDTNPDFGTLADLAPDRSRVERSLTDLITDLDRIDSSAALRPYMSQLPSGLHLLAAPANAERMAEMTPEVYERLLGFLGRFYELVLLDCGTGITDPLAMFAIKRSDQTVVVTTPDWVTAAQVLGALHHLSLERGTLVLNRAHNGRRSGQQAIAARFAEQRIAKRVTIPCDDRLHTMLDSGTYSLERLDRRLRLAVKRLSLAVGQQLV